MSELIEQHRLPSGYEFVVLRGELGESVVFDVASSSDAGWSEFEELFEIDRTDYLGRLNDDFYRGIYQTRRIVRRIDGMEFGCTWWEAPENANVTSEVDSLLEKFEAAGYPIPYDWESEEYDPVIFTPLRRLSRPVLEVVLPS